MLEWGLALADPPSIGFNNDHLSKDQNCKPGRTRYRSQHALSKVAEIGSCQYQAMVSYFRWSAKLDHCESLPCSCLDYSRAREHAKICLVALLWSKMWSSQVEVFPISTRSGFHSATNTACLVSDNTKLIVKSTKRPIDNAEENQHSAAMSSMQVCTISDYKQFQWDEQEHCICEEANIT